jgi:hypothetical protein
VYVVASRWLVVWAGGWWCGQVLGSSGMQGCGTTEPRLLLHLLTCCHQHHTYLRLETLAR